ncbi:TPA: ECs_2282 family putative zinc-binding protein [Citrobacter braakii]|uniref:ECs_2282 family putative zinc-binding protein n=1 Tax=Citrobacter freundii complex TaxID=1344959 RepID=UPI003990531B
MSETFEVKFTCPDCGSKSFIFSAEPCTMDNLESCAACGKVITQDDVIEHSRKIAKKRADEILRNAFKR